MGKWRQRLFSRGGMYMLWVALCFGVTSAAYLSWLDHLVGAVDSRAADWISMGAGYPMQAAGTGLVCHLLRRPVGDLRRAFTAAALLFGAVSVPALLADSPAAVIGFGWAMNLLCGVIAGFYLYAVARSIDADHRGRAFGGGYAVATVAVGLMALIAGGGLLHSGYALLIYLPLCALMCAAAHRLNALEAPEDAPAGEPASGEPSSVALACVVVLLLSAVKNIGFSFPSADIAAGVIPELSRLPYAIGLAAAGWINDRDRKTGMICTLAALILPFIMLGLAGQPVPATICWGLDYLFYGFFSVYRVVLFMDIADGSRRDAAGARRLELAPLGLLMGRLGDVAGTSLGLLLSGRPIALLSVTALAFFPTVFLFFRQYQRLYEPEAVRQCSEQEVFEAFCLRNDLSAREREVLRMVLDNRSNGEIAEALFIAESTVKYHVRNVLQKVGCKNRVELQKKFRLALYPQLSDAVTGDGPQ